MQTSFTETPVKGMSGGIADARPYKAATGINPTSSVIALRPGRFVCRNSTVAGREKEVRPPATAADVTGAAARGFVILQTLHTNPTVNTNVDRAYFQPSEQLAYMHEGVMFVDCETGWTAGQNVYVRFAAGAGTVLGSVRNDADVIAGPLDTAVLCQFARFEDSGSGPGVATIKFDILPATA